MRAKQVIAIQDTLHITTDTVQDAIQADSTVAADSTAIIQAVEKPVPTPEQIRYWRWLREKKLVVGESRYIEPKPGTVLTTTKEHVKNRIGLPVYERNPFNTDWITVILALTLIVLASVRITYAKYIGSLFQSIINYSTASRMFRNRNYSFSHGAFRLEFFFYLVISVFLFQLLNFFQVEKAQVNLFYFARILILILIYIFGKKMLYTVLGSIFETATVTSEYLFNVDNFNRVLGIFLLPVIALINYYPSGSPVFIVVLGIVLSAGMYIFQLIRGISILLKKQFSKFYLFLYLCTLEFLPLLLIYKAVVL